MGRQGSVARGMGLTGACKSVHFLLAACHDHEVRQEVTCQAPPPFPRSGRAPRQSRQRVGDTVTPRSRAPGRRQRPPAPRRRSRVYQRTATHGSARQRTVGESTSAGDAGKKKKSQCGDPPEPTDPAAPAERLRPTGGARPGSTPRRGSGDDRPNAARTAAGVPATSTHLFFNTNAAPPATDATTSQHTRGQPTGGHWRQHDHRFHSTTTIRQPHETVCRESRATNDKQLSCCSPPTLWSPNRPSMRHPA